MKQNIFLLLIMFIAIVSKSQTPQVPAGKPGKVQLPAPNLQPIPALAEKISFEAVITTEQPGPRSPLRFDAVRYNDGNAFSSSQNAFIAPTAGLYFFSVNLSWNGYGCGYAGGSVSVTALKNAREGIQSINELAPHGDGFSTVLTFSTKLIAGDKITVSVVNILCTSGGGSTALLRKGIFSGYRVYAD